jgi:hypothetical protein
MKFLDSMIGKCASRGPNHTTFESENYRHSDIIFKFNFLTL